MKSNYLLIPFILLCFTFITCRVNKNIVQDKPMIFIEGGSFMMGTSKGKKWDRPPHEVNLTSFYMDQYEVTNAEYCNFLNQHGNKKEKGAYWLDIESTDCSIEKVDNLFVPKTGLENHPVVEVTWYGANAYAQHLGKRLPTEAEWEYAARGGNKSKNFTFSGASDPLNIGWFLSNTKNLQPIGKKPPNELMIYDMSGNVYEWCSDWYDRLYYSKSPINNPTGAIDKDDPLYKVIRGGCWISIPDFLRVTRRNSFNPDFSDYTIGFRCVKDVL